MLGELFLQGCVAILEQLVHVSHGVVVAPGVGAIAEADGGFASLGLLVIEVGFLQELSFDAGHHLFGKVLCLLC